MTPPSNVQANGGSQMIVPMYMSEVSIPGIRGTLVVLQQLSITLGILVSYWLEYGTHYIGGVRCNPSISYSGGTASDRTFNPLQDVGPHGCTGQSDASWRVPFALQIVPAVILGLGMLAFPESPRFMVMKKREDRALACLSKLRRMHVDTEALRNEFLAIKAEVLFEEDYVRTHYPGKTGLSLSIAQYVALVSTWPAFRRLSIGCCTMFFQQFMGCNAMICKPYLFSLSTRLNPTPSHFYEPAIFPRFSSDSCADYAPTIFAQLGLAGNTTSLLATGVYGIVNTLSTLPALFLIDKVGRRPLLMCGALGTFISLVIVGGIIGAYGSSLVNHKTAGWVGIAFIYIYGKSPVLTPPIIPRSGVLIVIHSC